MALTPEEIRRRQADRKARGETPDPPPSNKHVRPAYRDLPPAETAASRANAKQTPKPSAGRPRQAKPKTGETPMAGQRQAGTFTEAPESNFREARFTPDPYDTGEFNRKASGVEMRRAPKTRPLRVSRTGAVLDGMRAGAKVVAPALAAGGAAHLLKGDGELEAEDAALAAGVGIGAYGGYKGKQFINKQGGIRAVKAKAKSATGDRLQAAGDSFRRLGVEADRSRLDRQRGGMGPDEFNAARSDLVDREVELESRADQRSQRARSRWQQAPSAAPAGAVPPGDNLNTRDLSPGQSTRMQQLDAQFRADNEEYLRQLDKDNPTQQDMARRAELQQRMESARAEMDGLRSAPEGVSQAEAGAKPASQKVEEAWADKKGTARRTVDAAEQMGREAVDKARGTVGEAERMGRETVDKVKQKGKGWFRSAADRIRAIRANGGSAAGASRSLGAGADGGKKARWRKTKAGGKLLGAAGSMAQAGALAQDIADKGIVKTAEDTAKGLAEYAKDLSGKDLDDAVEQVASDMVHGLTQLPGDVAKYGWMLAGALGGYTGLYDIDMPDFKRDAYDFTGMDEGAANKRAFFDALVAMPRDHREKFLQVIPDAALDALRLSDDEWGMLEKWTGAAMAAGDEAVAVAPDNQLAPAGPAPDNQPPGFGQPYTPRASQGLALPNNMRVVTDPDEARAITDFGLPPQGTIVAPARNQGQDLPAEDYANEILGRPQGTPVSEEDWNSTVSRAGFNLREMATGNKNIAEGRRGQGTFSVMPAAPARNRPLDTGGSMFDERGFYRTADRAVQNLGEQERAMYDRFVGQGMNQRQALRMLNFVALRQQITGHKGAMTDAQRLSHGRAERQNAQDLFKQSQEYAAAAVDPNTSPAQKQQAWGSAMSMWHADPMGPAGAGARSAAVQALTDALGTGTLGDAFTGNTRFKDWWNNDTFPRLQAGDANLASAGWFYGKDGLLYVRPPGQDETFGGIDVRALERELPQLPGLGTVIDQLMRGGQ